jgi:twitching motility two-component system response regulator PilG
MKAPWRIVVLDDDARVRQLIQSALRPPEFEVFAFADGRDALMRLHEIEPALILSDVWMPDLDGRLFLQVVKRSPALREVPFVFLTAVSGDTAVDAALQAGADGFLMKPFPVTLLREKVRTLLGMPLEGPATRRRTTATRLPRRSSALRSRTRSGGPRARAERAPAGGAAACGRAGPRMGGRTSPKPGTARTSRPRSRAASRWRRSAGGRSRC